MTACARRESARKECGWVWLSGAGREVGLGVRQSRVSRVWPHTGVHTVLAPRLG